MRKNISLLLAGALLLSLLLSACGAPAVEAPTPEMTKSPVSSAAAESRSGAVISSAAPESTPPVPSEEPSAEPTEEPEQAVESEEVPAVVSAVPQTAAPAVVSTPKPVVNTPAPATPAPVVSTQAPDVPPAVASVQPEPAPEPVPTSEPAAPKATKEAAQAFIGRSVSSLIAAIGQPNGRDYAPSCLGSGEDGELFYDGFTVYTYREGNTETVQDVI